MIESAFYILGYSEQPLSTYPDLIPVVERVFAASKSKQLRVVAASLLDQSGMHIPEVDVFFMDALNWKVIENELQMYQHEFTIRETAKLVPCDVVATLLNDFSLTRGQWILRTQVPGKKYQGITAVIDNTWFELGDPDKGENRRTPDPNDIFNFVGWWPSWRYEMGKVNDSKQISLFQVDSSGGDSKEREKPGTRRIGIYELTDTTLRIQLAKVGEPRPTELVKEESKLPEGHTLLELDRLLDEALTKPTSPE